MLLSTREEGPPTACSHRLEKLSRKSKKATAGQTRCKWRRSEVSNYEYGKSQGIDARTLRVGDQVANKGERIHPWAGVR
jgi:hypothetical protein